MRTLNLVALLVLSVSAAQAAPIPLAPGGQGGALPAGPAVALSGMSTRSPQVWRLQEPG